MIDQKDPYVGQREPVNRLRHGHGVYTYDNSYFQYEGEWVNGKKEGHGILRMKCGNGCDIYEGDFQNGEIEGKGVIKYSNGNKYEGEFHLGEKNGYGVFTSKQEEYQGEWYLNMRHGKGFLKRENGDLVDGSFVNHKAEGYCNITYGNGSSYVGNMKRGLRDGLGKYIDTENKYNYEGDYKEDMKHGQGIIKFDSGFVYEGQFVNDEPSKKQQTNESQSAIQVEYEILSHPINFEIYCSYQGIDIEDPNQPSEEEIQELIKNWEKENKKIKNPPPMPDYRAPRMITPAPEIVTFESGRLVKIELSNFVNNLQYLAQLPEVEKGKESEPRILKYFKFDYRQELQQRREFIQKYKEEKQKEAEILAQQQQEEQQKTKKAGKKDTKKQEQVQEDDLKLNLFKDDLENKDKCLILSNIEGKIEVQNIEFPEDFPTGKYQILITDASREKYGNIVPLTVDILINPQGGLDPKKKGKK